MNDTNNTVTSAKSAPEPPDMTIVPGHVEALRARIDEHIRRMTSGVSLSVLQDELCREAAQALIASYVHVLTSAGVPKALAQKELMYEVLRRLFGSKPDTQAVRIVADFEPPAPGTLALDIQVKRG